MEITTKKGEKIFVSEPDAGWVTRLTWYVNKDGYAQTMLEGRPVMLHRMVAKAGPGEMTDHRDMDKLNNTRENLRLASRSQNAANRKINPISKNRFKGVSWNRKANRWEACVTKDGKDIFSRSHRTEEEAARAYDELARKHYGEFARLNFAEAASP